uniref:Uncharacterized protein n=1 Tax=Arundo donax TaxID=35708 RepID=A0A0A9DV79_ARUDO
MVQRLMDLVTEHVGPAPEPVVVRKSLDWSHCSNSKVLEGKGLQDSEDWSDLYTYRQQTKIYRISQYASCFLTLSHNAKPTVEYLSFSSFLDSHTVTDNKSKNIALSY